MAGKRGTKGKRKKTTEDPSPPPSPHQAGEESHPTCRASSLSNLPTSHRPSIQPQKKAKTVTNLTANQEDDLASWLEVNDLIYNKKVNAYKDLRKKDALWESKAASMDKDVDILKTWYRSIRTRYTRLVHRKSGASDLTERDRWVLQNFAWLRIHVVEVKRKTTVSMKEKIAGAASVEEVEDDQSEASTEIETEATSRQRLEPLYRRSSASSTKKASQEEEQLQSNIATRGEQSIAFQTKILEMLAPRKATERTAYADWMKEVMMSLHPLLWLKFQRECNNLLYTYQEKNEELLHPVAQQQHNATQQQQYQAYPRTFSSTSSTSVMWKPPPQKWPATVQQNMSVWGSQNPVWVQRQMTELQPMQMTTVVSGPAPPATATTSTPTQSAEPSFHLSNHISDSVDMTKTSPDRTVAALDDCRDQEKE